MSILARQKALPGMGADPTVMPREKLLLRWLRERGLTLTEDVAHIMGGVHRTFPGKCLVKCVDALPSEMRKKLLAYGIPEHLLPPVPEKKKAAARPPSRSQNYCAF